MGAPEGAYKEQVAGPEHAIAPEDELRANMYRLLACFLSSPPGERELRYAAEMIGDNSPLGEALSTFAQAARNTTPSRLSEQYHELFIGLSRGKLLPFGSYYLTGFLNEKPLARLRGAMSKLGIERDPGNKDPEDHIAAVLDMMAGLIRGEFGKPATLEQQKQFFEEHLNSWAPHFFRDLEAEETSELYASLGTIGRLFLQTEETAFGLS